MTSRVFLRDVMVRAVELQPCEAVAIAQQVIVSTDIDAGQRSPHAALSLDSIRLGADGSVVCEPCVTRPGPAEIGRLLAEMLPHNGSARVPGALRFTIARALLQVEAPPFDSVFQLSAVLSRHEQRDRIAIVRDLYARAATKSTTTNTATGADRRRQAPDAATLRRQLREADEELFAHLNRTVAQPAAPQPAPPRTAMVDPFVPRFESLASPVADRHFKAADWVAGAMVALLISFGAGYTAVTTLRRPHLARPAAPAPLATEPSTIDTNRRQLRDDETVAPGTVSRSGDRHTSSAR